MTTQLRLFLIAIFIFFGMMFCASKVVAKITLVSSQIGKTHAPSGSTDVVMLRTTLGSTSEKGDVIKKFMITNTSEEVSFGEGISIMRVYQDKDANGALEESDGSALGSRVLSSSDMNSTLSIPLDAGLLVTSENHVNLFFVYDISLAQATLGKTTNFTLTSVDTGGDTAGDGDLVMKTITSSSTPTINNTIITGIHSVEIMDIAPNVVIPGQTNVPMLYVRMVVVGENIGFPSKFAFTIFNDAANFVTAEGAKNGIVKATMYDAQVAPDESLGPDFQADNETEVIKRVSSTEFRDASTFDFSFPPILGSEFKGFEIGHGADRVTRDFFITYDIGTNITVTSDTKINAQLFEFIGTGSSSKMQIKWPDTPSDRREAAESSVAGLSLEGLANIVPKNNVFGPLSNAPILKMTLRANHTSITVNTMTIVNTGTVPYITDSGGSRGVAKVDIYNDSDGNNTFSDVSDIKVGSFELGNVHPETGETNQSDAAKIPLATAVNNVLKTGIQIGKYNKDQEYPLNNDEIFFVRYYFGELIDNSNKNASGNVTAIARLGAVSASANIEIGGVVTSNTLSLPNTNKSPAVASPEAVINMSQTNVSLVDVVDISPDKAVKGQLKVPLLWVHLSSNTKYTSSNFTILNEKLSFLNDNTGVSKVWVYRDNTPFKVLDANDTFMSASSIFSNRSEVGLSGIDITTGDNYYLVLYDMGLSVSSSSPARSQLNKIAAETGTSLLLGGVLPNPIKSASVSVTDSLIGKTVIKGVDEVVNATVSFNMTVSFKNISGAPLTIESVTPKFYYSSVSGTDITYEFKIIPEDTFPLVVQGNITKNMVFNVRHEDAFTEGTTYVDAFIKYQTSTGASAIINRYKGKESWVSASVRTPILTIFSKDNQYRWQFPAYIDHVDLLRGGKALAFLNNMAVRLSDQLNIYFKAEGNFIDESSLNLSLSGTALTRVAGGQNLLGTFSYNSGVLNVPDLGNSGGTLLLNVRDLNNNALEEASISFELSNVVKLSNALFYPNPYQMGDTNLQLGFNITQPSTVTVYLFNFLGVEVFREEKSFTDIGYQKIKFDANSNVLAPGIYFVKIIAKDESGNIDTANTKLAIF